MITAQVKEKLRAGQVSLGSWLNLDSPAAAELMARAGFDWLIIEGEHGAASLGTVQLMLQAMNGTPTVPMMRVPWNDAVLVKVALDVGVKGIMFPMVNTRAEAIAAVRACKYPPAGVRGVGSGRASWYGQNSAEYLKTANDDQLIFIIVEHEQAVANIEEIVTVPGIDAISFGFADYAASLGLTGQNDHPRVLEARDTVLRACQRAGVAAAYAPRSVAQTQELAALGFRVFIVGGDARFIMNGAREMLAALRG
jgi:2-keto-3-deoxy-L-rhamnonate aldolase RhmA